MTPGQLAAVALGFAEVTEEQPFGPDVDVYKVRGKVFAIVSPDRSPTFVTIKCEPEQAVEWRAEFASVRAGYHMNKKHWNSVDLDGDVPDDVLEEMLEHSYRRVVAAFPRFERLRLLGD